MAVVALFAGVAFSGCFGNADPGTEPGPLPQAVLSHSPSAPQAGQVVAFDASRSLDGGVRFGGAAWNFGDGTRGDGLATTHVFDHPGKYVVTLRITNDAGAVATNDASLTYLDVTPPEHDLAHLTTDTPPVAAVAASAQVVQPGTLVSFDGRGSYGWITNPGFDPNASIDGDNAPALRDSDSVESFSWNFGEGASSTGNATDAGAVEHLFETPGLHPVTLTITTSSGATARAVYSVYVLAPGAPTPGGVKNPDVFTTVTLNGPTSLDPGYTYEAVGGHIVQNVYETLIYYDRDNYNRLRPVIAKEVPSRDNGGISEDGLTYVFKLRPGLLFHDGSTVDADAVKFSLDRPVLMNDPASPAWITSNIRGASTYMASRGTAEDRQAYLDAEGVEVVDPLTVRIHLEKPDATTLVKLAFAHASIVSPTAFKASHPERVALWGAGTTPDGLPPAATDERSRITRDPWANVHMVGTGPYKFRTWIPNDRIILDRFEGYWGEAPRIRTVVVQYVDDVNTRILMLLAGDADDAHVPPNVVDKLHEKRNVRVVEVESLDVDTVFFSRNVTSPDHCPKDAVTSEPDCLAFDDLHLRAAVTHAFDKTRYVNDINRKRTALVPSVVPEGMDGHVEDLKPHERDLAKAKEHLALSRHPDGLKDLVLVTASASTTNMATLHLLEENLHEIGIEATVIGLSFGQLIDGMTRSHFPMWMLGWKPDYASPENYVIPYLDGRTGIYAASASYADPEMNALIDAALAELDDEARKAVWEEVDRKAHEEYVQLWLGQRKNVHVERTWVTGYYYNPLESGAPNFAYYAAAGKA